MKKKYTIDNNFILDFHFNKNIALLDSTEHLYQMCDCASCPFLNIFKCRAADAFILLKLQNKRL